MNTATHHLNWSFGQKLCDRTHVVAKGIEMGRQVWHKKPVYEFTLFETRSKISEHKLVCLIIIPFCFSLLQPPTADGAESLSQEEPALKKSALGREVELLDKNATTGIARRRLSTYKVLRPTTLCVPFIFNKCFIFVIPVCSEKSDQSCHTYYQEEDAPYEVCNKDWTGKDCGIPVCQPTCPSGLTCVFPGKCDCHGTLSNGSCILSPCSSEISCFPGSCRSGSCICPPGFEGKDCLKILQAPEITTCLIKLQNSTGVKASTNCTQDVPEVPQVWVRSEDLVTIVINVQINLPKNVHIDSNNKRTKHVKLPLSFGIVEAGLEIKWGTSSSANLSCGHIDPDRPKTNMFCEIEKSLEDLNITHVDELIINIYAKLGGYKEGSMEEGVLGSLFSRKYFEGLTVTRTIKFKVDNQPPLHCYLKENNCDVYPIYMEADSTNTPTIEPKFYRWSDDESGIERFNVKIFRMRLSSAHNNSLVKSDFPLVDVNLNPSALKYQYNLTYSGVYSIELTVIDRAKNYAKARKIFLFVKESHTRINPMFPVGVRNTTKSRSNHDFWITDPALIYKLDVLEISWYAHFHSDAVYNKEWSRPVVPWGEGIEDIKFRHYASGGRTIAEKKKFYDGIFYYQIQYYINKKDMPRDEIYDHSVNVFAADTSAKITVPNLKNGDVIGFKLSSYDVLGGIITEKYKVVVDTTPPKISGTKIATNFYGYDYSIFVESVDEESGIESGNYTFYDKLSEKSVFHGEIKIEPCNRGEEDCLCSLYGNCYPRYQRIDIDHCPCSCKSKQEYHINLEVLNFAGLRSEAKEIHV